MRSRRLSTQEIQEDQRLLRLIAPMAVRIRSVMNQRFPLPMDPLLISLISACTALVASIVGPLVALTVAKRQINATVLSTNQLDQMIDTAFKRLESDGFHDAETGADIEGVTRLGQAILKREWQV